jgi:hypothetical protein
MSTIKDTDIINKYLININVPRDSSIPLEVYIAFPKTLTDLNTRETVKTQWLNGNDKQYVAMQLLYNNELAVIFRPIGVQIDWQNITITSYTPSGLGINIPTRFLRTLGVTIETQIENLNDYLYITLEKTKDGLVAKEVTPLRGRIETDIAKEILAKSELTPIDILVTGLGYKPNNAVKRLFTPRIVSWFKGFDGKPMHIAQFTEPETAKTHFGIRNETLYNWRYIPEPPTLARLILDARNGILGEVFLRNGIIFDEFDKWDLGTPDRRMTFDAILTGMEQGKWVRGVSAMGIRPPDIARLIPIIFFGNLGDFAKLYGNLPLCTRAWFTEVYSRRLTHDVSALADRLAIIDACFTKIPIMDSLTYKVLPDSVLRGIVANLQSEVKQVDVSKLKGRLKRHSDNLYAIMNTFVKISPETCDKIVAGTLDWDKDAYVVTPQISNAPLRDVTPTIPATQTTPQEVLQGEIKQMHNVIAELSKDAGMIEKAYLLKYYNEKYGTTAEHFRNVYNATLKEGYIVEPKEGYAKTT